MSDNNENINEEMVIPDDPGVPASSNPSISFVRWGLTVVTSLLILFIGMGVFKTLKAMKQPPPKKPVTPRTLKVQVEEAAIGDYRVEIEGQGTIAARTQIKIIPEVNGKIVYANPAFRNGGSVKKGELLYRIEKSDYTQAHNQAQGSLNAYESEIAFQESQRVTLQNQLERAMDSWRISKEEADRVQRLFDQGASAEAEVNQRLAAEKSSLERVEQLKSQLALIDPAIERIKSNMEVAKAALGKANIALGRTEYYAPFDGGINGNSLSEGQFVGAGQSLGRLIATGVYEVPVPVTVSDWKALAPGYSSVNVTDAPVTAEVVYTDNDGTRHIWPGRVVRLGSELDMATRLVDVVVEIDSALADMQIIPGMFCEVTFFGQTLGDVVVIPRRALREGDIVYLAKEEKVEKTIRKDELLAFADKFSESVVEGMAGEMRNRFEEAVDQRFGMTLTQDIKQKMQESIPEEDRQKLLDDVKGALKELLVEEFPEGKDEIKIKQDEKELKIRPVKVWRHEGEQIVVLDGLDTGDVVITSVVEEVIDGIPVIIISRNGENVAPPISGDMPTSHGRGH